MVVCSDGYSSSDFAVKLVATNNAPTLVTAYDSISIHAGEEVSLLISADNFEDVDGDTNITAVLYL